MQKGHLLTTSEGRRTGLVVGQVEQHPVYNLPPAKKRVRVDEGTGGETCEEIHEFYTTLPTAGTVDIDYDLNGTVETLTFNHNSTATAFDTELNTHSQASAVPFTVDGGPWPEVAIYVNFGKVAVTFPAIDNSSLTGGGVAMRKFSTAET